MKEDEILKRKHRIWELCVLGFTQQQMAKKLNVSIKTISRDYAELKTDSLEWMEALPKGEIQLHYKKNFEMVQKVIQQLWEIYQKTKDEDKKIKILDEITKKSSLHTDIIGSKILGMRYRIRSTEKTLVDNVQEFHEMNKEHQRLLNQDKN